MTNTNMIANELKSGSVTVTFKQDKPCSLFMRGLSIKCGHEETRNYLIDPVVACQPEKEGPYVRAFIKETLEQAGSNSLVGVSKYLPDVVERWVIAQIKGEKLASNSIDANTLLLDTEKAVNYQKS